MDRRGASAELYGIDAVLGGNRHYGKVEPELACSTVHAWRTSTFCPG